MELIPVKTTDPYYAEAERLMTDAFPPEERRPLDRQRQYTDHNPLFHPQVVVENGTFAGLFNYWTLDESIWPPALPYAAADWDDASSTLSSGTPDNPSCWKWSRPLPT